MIISGRKIIKGLLTLSIIAIIIGVIATGMQLSSSSYIALIRIDGEIGEQSSSYWSKSRSSFLQQLQTAANDPSVKAIVLRINSPGGSAAASQELYHTVLQIRQQGIPVVASLGDTAASGGYYVAAAADYILAQGSTITGSIGVIMQTVNLEELYEKIGIEVQTIKSGQFKDTGNASRPLTDAEIELLSELINDAWDQFVNDVATARKLDRQAVEAVADGRILTGRQALHAGLIDELGGLEEAIQKAAEFAGIQSSYLVRTYEQSTSLLDRLMDLTSKIPFIKGIWPSQILSMRYQL